MIDDDPCLVRAAQAGDLRAFETLVARHQGRVFAAAWSILGHAEDARDAVQEAFLEGFRSLSRLEDPAAFGAWVTGIARHVSLAIRNRRGARRPLSGGGPAAADRGDGPLMQMIRQEEDTAMREAARRVLDALPAELKDVLRLRYENDLSYDEIAAARGLTRDTVRGRLYRAHRKVQEEIARRTAGGRS